MKMLNRASCLRRFITGVLVNYCSKGVAHEVIPQITDELVSSVNECLELWNAATLYNELNRQAEDVII